MNILFSSYPLLEGEISYLCAFEVLISDYSEIVFDDAFILAEMLYTLFEYVGKYILLSRNQLLYQRNAHLSSSVR